MLNNGIQYFNNFKYLSININQYYEKLKIISQQINNILTSQQMMNQMAQQPMQQNMLLQQQMMQAQMMEPMQIQLNNNRKKCNIMFSDDKKRITNLYVDADITIKELIDKYMNRVYGYEKSDLEFIFNAKKIDRISQIILREFFGIYLNQNPKITVFELRNIK